jgi:hypothetical protein
MLALGVYRARLGPCGHYLPETTGPDAEDRYTADVPMRCHACTAVAQRAHLYRDDPHPQALLYHAERR